MRSLLERRRAGDASWHFEAPLLVIRLVGGAMASFGRKPLAKLISAARLALPLNLALYNRLRTYMTAWDVP